MIKLMFIGMLGLMWFLVVLLAFCAPFPLNVLGMFGIVMAIGLTGHVIKNWDILSDD